MTLFPLFDELSVEDRHQVLMVRDKAVAAVLRGSPEKRGWWRNQDENALFALSRYITESGEHLREIRNERVIQALRATRRTP